MTAEHHGPSSASADSVPARPRAIVRVRRLRGWDYLWAAFNGRVWSWRCTDPECQALRLVPSLALYRGRTATWALAQQQADSHLRAWHRG